MSVKELTEHPNWEDLIEHLQKRVDNQVGNVLGSAQYDSLDAIRYNKGVMDGMRAIITEMRRIQRGDRS